ncbi:uncharacterized protein ACB058_008253 [Synchiropus picturatus]
MEGVELEEALRNFPQLPVWIIEHVWARRVMDLQHVVDSSLWPDVDSQPLSLEEPWRVRVTSARAYSVVKSRDVPRFESVIRFLEATHRLVPGLVKAIKHMKIVFGLKTLIVMRMLRDGCSSIDTSLKILHFFPTDLPEYRGQCSPREMFLMRKNHLDFRVLAQILTTDGAKRQYYVEHHLDQQYGEAYTQKVEERLLHYLLQLEPALPRDTRVDQVRRKSPESDEERLLLRVVSADAVTIATTLERLLCCDAASCRPSSSSRPPDDRRDSERSNDARVCCCELKASSPSTPSPSSPQFCSRHRRWVQSILSECPAESSDPGPISPPLFQSSPSGSSSQELTPSGLLPLPPPRRELFLHDDSLPLGSPSPRPQSPALPVPDSDPAPSSSSCRQESVESDPPSLLNPPGSPLSSIEVTRKDLDSLVALEPLRGSEPPDSASHRSDQDRLVVRSRTDQPRLSMQTQQVLLCSKLLQPRVSVSRLEVPDCYRPVSPGEASSPDETDEQESSFDVNSLFTDSSSSASDSKDSDYQPSSKKLRNL